MTPSDEIGRQLVKLADEWRAEAQRRLRLAKRHRCRSEETIRHGYVREAGKLMECADAIEAIANADAATTA